MALSIYYDGGRRNGGHDEVWIVGSDNAVNKGIVDEIQLVNSPSNKKGSSVTYDKIPSSVRLQPLSYLE